MLNALLFKKIFLYNLPQTEIKSKLVALYISIHYGNKINNFR
jgi:hypothetical protein